MARNVEGGNSKPVHVTNDTVAVTVSGGLPAGNNVLGSVTLVYPSYTTWATGELQGNAAATQMPSVACKMVKFKAQVDNAGNVYIGIAGVTKAAGDTDTTTGFQLDAGEETPWLLADNLSRFFRICDNAGDDLTYIAAVS